VARPFPRCISREGSGSFQNAVAQHQHNNTTQLRTRASMDLFQSERVRVEAGFPPLEELVWRRDEVARRLAAVLFARENTQSDDNCSNNSAAPRLTLGDVPLDVVRQICGLLAASAPRIPLLREVRLGGEEVAMRHAMQLISPGPASPDGHRYNRFQRSVQHGLFEEDMEDEPSNFMLVDRGVEFATSLHLSAPLSGAQLLDDELAGPPSPGPVRHRFRIKIPKDSDGESSSSSSDDDDWLESESSDEEEVDHNDQPPNVSRETEDAQRTYQTAACCVDGQTVGTDQMIVLVREFLGRNGVKRTKYDFDRQQAFETVLAVTGTLLAHAELSNPIANNLRSTLLHDLSQWLRAMQPRVEGADGNTVRVTAYNTAAALTAPSPERVFRYARALESCSRVLDGKILADLERVLTRVMNATRVALFVCGSADEDTVPQGQLLELMDEYGMDFFHIASDGGWQGALRWICGGAPPEITLSTEQGFVSDQTSSGSISTLETPPNDEVEDHDLQAALELSLSREVGAEGNLNDDANHPFIGRDDEMEDHELQAAIELSLSHEVAIGGTLDADSDHGSAVRDEMEDHDLQGAIELSLSHEVDVGEDLEADDPGFAHAIQLAIELSMSQEIDQHDAQQQHLASLEQHDDAGLSIAGAYSVGDRHGALDSATSSADSDDDRDLPAAMELSRREASTDKRLRDATEDDDESEWHIE
jgi:Ubiquitin interaction motif